MRAPRPSLWAVPLVLAVALAGCAAPLGAAPTAEPSAPVVTSTPDLEPTVEPTYTAPEADSGATALTFAVDALTMYARPHVPREQWLAELTPFLSSNAYQGYATVDPANVPALVLHPDTARLAPGAVTLACNVLIDTSAGTWNLALVRQGPDYPWQVSRFIPPEGR